MAHQTDAADSGSDTDCELAPGLGKSPAKRQSFFKADLRLLFASSAQTSKNLSSQEDALGDMVVNLEADQELGNLLHARLVEKEVRTRALQTLKHSDMKDRALEDAFDVRMRDAHFKIAMPRTAHNSEVLAFLFHGEIAQLIFRLDRVSLGQMRALMCSCKAMMMLVKQLLRAYRPIVIFEVRSWELSCLPACC